MKTYLSLHGRNVAWERQFSCEITEGGHTTE